MGEHTWGNFGHEDTIDALAERLAEKYPEGKVMTRLEYNIPGGHSGEMDVALFLPAIDGLGRQRIRYYEVKNVKNTDQAYSKAQWQYYKARQSFPECDVRGIYVGRDGVRIIDPLEWEDQVHQPIYKQPDNTQYAASYNPREQRERFDPDEEDEDEDGVEERGLKHQNERRRKHRREPPSRQRRRTGYAPTREIPARRYPQDR